jgi:hypothetical protein
MFPILRLFSTNININCNCQEILRSAIAKKKNLLPVVLDCSFNFIWASDIVWAEMGMGCAGFESYKWAFLYFFFSFEILNMKLEKKKKWKMKFKISK